MPRQRYALANLTHDQLLRIEDLESQLGVTLIAWEPEGEADRSATSAADQEADALGDHYDFLF